MRDRRIHGDNADEGNDDSTCKRDLRRISFSIQEALCRLHAIDHRKPYGNEADGKAETEDKDHGKTSSKLSDGNRCEQNSQRRRAGDDPAGYTQQNQPHRTEGLVAGSVVMVVGVMVVGMTVCIPMVVVVVVLVPMVVVDMVRGIMGVRMVMGVIMSMIVVVIGAMVTVAVTEQVKMVVGTCRVLQADPPLPQHPETDAKNNEACYNSEIGMNFLF